MNFIDKIKLLKKKYDFVFFSEETNYQKYFIDLIKNLSALEKKIIYLSSDKFDKINEKNVINVFIGKGLLRTFFFSLIKCKYFFMTLTDLNNHDVKKNKKIDKYIYVFHAANSTHRAYTETAFNNYDVILCPGFRHELEIKKMENLYNLKKKIIIKSGYFFLDTIRKSYIKKKIQKKSILIAPSWNYNKENFVNNYLEKILDILLAQKKYKIVFRPHPETIKREKKFIINIKNKYTNFKNFLLDLEKNNLFSMQNSDLLITDYSGIAIEFILGLKKPAIFFTKYKKIHNPNYKLIAEKTFEDDVKEKFGLFVEDPKFDQIDQYIDNALEKFLVNQKKIDGYLVNNFFNLDCSASFVSNLFKNNKI
jgi:CDP-glycerol glycerophosphotransferase (TagB/SpsB family)